jgi:hypothetical protein
MLMLFYEKLNSLVRLIHVAKGVWLQHASNRNASFGAACRFLLLDGYPDGLRILFSNRLWNFARWIRDTPLFQAIKQLPLADQHTDPTSLSLPKVF